MTETTDPLVEQPAAWRQRAVMRSLGAAHTRAEQQIDQFLDAAFALIDERGAADFTIREVSERCDESIRRFYQYFDGKDELLLALFEVSVLEQTDDLRRTVDEESEPLARLRAFTIRSTSGVNPRTRPKSRDTHVPAHRRLRGAALDRAPRTRRGGHGADLATPARLLEDAVAAGVVRVASCRARRCS